MSIRESQQDSERKSTVVIGAGAWGTTIANLVASTGRACTLVTHTAEHSNAINAVRENERYLPAIHINDRVVVTDAAGEAVGASDIVVIAVPSQQVRSTVTEVRRSLRPDGLIVSCAKGLELGSLLRMTEVVVDAGGLSPERVCALSGPNLAREIAQGLPASAVIASRSEAAAEEAREALAAASFRLYTSTDVVGVELGGSLKNIIALGAGVADGLGLGQNAKASFMTRGLAEIIRLGVAAGANPLTFGGLSGLGDLIATCESPLSRNRTLGEKLGRGMSLEEAVAGSPHVVEGLTTAQAALQLAERYHVEMPIAATVVSVIDGRLSVREAIGTLMSRGARPELDAAP